MPQEKIPCFLKQTPENYKTSANPTELSVRLYLQQTAMETKTSWCRTNLHPRLESPKHLSVSPFTSIFCIPHIVAK